MGVNLQIRPLVPAGILALVLSMVPLSSASEQGYEPPKTADGRPDLQGIWQVMNTAAWDIQDHGADRDVPAGQGVVEGNEIPYQPSALEKKKQNSENRKTADPEAQCFLPGVPRTTYMPFPFQIVQTASQVTILYEYAHAIRNIYTDGSAHPEGQLEWWMGDSRGRWEGNTLVVDVVHFSNKTWFDRAGNFHSEALHLVERYTPVGPNHMRYEVTIEDPKVFTKPWRMSMTLYRRQEPNVQILEYECYSFDKQ